MTYNEAMVELRRQCAEDTTTARRLRRAASHINAIELHDGCWAHYAEETGHWYIITAHELEELCDYLDDSDPEISSNAYSHWCAGTNAEEQPKGWEPKLPASGSLVDG
jgi:hypothetical protein